MTTQTQHTKFMYAALIADECSISFTSPNSFDTYEEAVKDWELNCRDRKKGDEYDIYWNNLPCIIVKETNLRELLFHGVDKRN